MIYPAIIIPAYKRTESINRLLKSINESVFPNKEIKLIISLEGGSSKNVVEFAKSFSFKSGNVEIVERKKRMGLRDHIIWCGDQTEKYGSVIVLEDDLMVDPYFYVFALAALTFYEKDDKVAGIALYSQRHNQYARLPFEPQFNGTSAYFMQVACSWGQCWTKNQWIGFKEFYNKSSEKDVEECEGLPDAVKKWPVSSWKKYFSAYLISKSKTFVYPYISYTTNCSDEGGMHVLQQSNLYQVPMSARKRVCETFVFDKNSSDPIVGYDAFMEPTGIEFFERIGVNKGDVEVDFYGTKPLPLLLKKEYSLTIKNSSNPLKLMPIRFKPIESNIFSSDNADLYAVLSKSTNLLEKNKKDEFRKYLKMSEHLCYAPFIVLDPLTIRMKFFIFNFLKRILKKILA